MRSGRQLLLLVPILLVGAMLAAIALLPTERADAAMWWITGLSGLSILAYVFLAHPRRWGSQRAVDQGERRQSKFDGGQER